MSQRTEDISKLFGNMTEPMIPILIVFIIFGFIILGLQILYKIIKFPFKDKNKGYYEGTKD